MSADGAVVRCYASAAAAHLADQAGALADALDNAESELVLVAAHCVQPAMAAAARAQLPAIRDALVAAGRRAGAGDAPPWPFCIRAYPSEDAARLADHAEELADALLGVCAEVVRLRPDAARTGTAGAAMLAAHEALERAGRLA